MNPARTTSLRMASTSEDHGRPRRRIRHEGPRPPAPPPLPPRRVRGPVTSMHEPEMRAMDRWWRAANYLSVGQIYLMDNPLLREPLRLEHVKPRLLGHWGTCPGLSLLYV